MANEKQRKIIAIITTIAMILGCLVIPSGTVSEAASNKLKVTCKKTVAINCTTTIKTNVKAKFKSSNKKIATVSSKGVVKGKKAGKVKITVTSKSNKKLKKTVTITVKNQLVINAPTGSKATLYVGESVKIKTNLSSKFKSSDSSVATVSSSGKVVAKKAGTAKITVTSKSNKKLKKTVTITVKNKPESTTETTTEKPTTEDQTTTEKPTTEDQTTTEQETTEKDSSTEEPTEPVPVKINAKYRGDKVPNNKYLIDQMGIDIEVEYSDGHTEPIFVNYYNTNDIKMSDIKEEIAGDKTYYKFEVTYKDLPSVDIKVEAVDVDVNLYPQDFIMYFPNDFKIKKGEKPKSKDISEAYLLYLNGAEISVDDTSQVYFNLYYDYADEGTNRYEFNAIYDYWFDYNGENLYVFLRHPIYVPYE